jgi:RNA polymerase sigma factor (sigma-70 family)
MGYQRVATSDLGRIFLGETVAGLSEWQLLERYLEGRDELAFKALVARHGPMVLGVCRRMLSDQTDVEDAFQATFLVLVRRARQLGPADALGPWLYGVAARVALRARSDAARRRRIEPISQRYSSDSGDRPAIDRELGEVLDQELDRLPTKYRSPIVLCYLEGQTHEEAARQLKWPIGTVKGRLARARDLLRSRLVRRGLGPAVAALSPAIARDASAALHEELVDRTVQSAFKVAFGLGAAHVVSTSITSLVEGVLTSMFIDTLKWAGLAVIVSGLALTGAVVSARQETGQRERKPSEVVASASDASSTKWQADGEAASAVRSVDRVKSAERTLTLADLQKDLVRAARLEWEHSYRDYLGNDTGLERTYQASKRLMDAEQERASAVAERATAAKAHLDRVREMARTQHGNLSATELQSAQMRAYAAEAELWLAQATKGVSRIAKETSASGEPREGHGNDPQSQRIRSQLDFRITMPFANETPLSDILKHIKEKTTSPDLPTGIPIYVDPIGLQEAEKTLESTVIIDLDGVPLRRTLQLVLKQLGLVYFIDDGMLYITSDESEDGPSLGPPMREPSQFHFNVEKAERGELTLEQMKELIEFLETRHDVLELSEGRRIEHRGGSTAATAGPVTQNNKESVELLVKEIRELVELLKSTKQTEKPSVRKGGLQ